MARSIWSGTISFGMIAIPIKMFTAVRHKGVSFNQLDDRNMGRIRYQKVSEQTGEEVPSDQIVKGYEITRGRYIMVDPDELEPFVPAATKTIDLEEFVDLDQIDPIFFEKPYYLAPHLSPKPYVLLARALESSGKVAIARFVMRNRQYTAAIRAETAGSSCPRLPTPTRSCRSTEVEELAALGDVTVADREVKMAEMLVESLTAESATVTSTAGASRSCLPRPRSSPVRRRPATSFPTRCSPAHTDSAFAGVAARFQPGATLSYADVSIDAHLQAQMRIWMLFARPTSNLPPCTSAAPHTSPRVTSIRSRSMELIRLYGDRPWSTGPIRGLGPRAAASGRDLPWAVTHPVAADARAAPAASMGPERPRLHGTDRHTQALGDLGLRQALEVLAGGRLAVHSAGSSVIA